MQQQMPKLKKKPKKDTFKGGKQKSKYNKPQPSEISQPGQAEEAKTEFPRNNNNNNTRRNRRNRQRKRSHKKMAIWKKKNNNSDRNRKEFHCTFPEANYWEHAHPRPY